MNIILGIIFGVVLIFALFNIETEHGRRVAISYVALVPAYLSIIAASTNVLLVAIWLLKSIAEKNGSIAKGLNILLMPVIFIMAILGIMITITWPNEIIGKVMNIAGSCSNEMLSTTISTVLAGLGTIGILAIFMYFIWKREVLPKLIGLLLVNPITAYGLYALIFNLTFSGGWVFAFPEPTSIFRNWW